MTSEPVANTERLIVPLASATDASTFGGKASRLGELSRLGFAVPDGIVVPNNVFEQWLKQAVKDDVGGSLELRIEQLLTEIKSADVTSVASVAAQIESLVLDHDLPRDLVESLSSAVQPLLARGPIVVRSSACGEDGVDAAFAGQLDSFLHIDSVQDALDAVRRCWASYWSHRSLAYQRSRSRCLAGMAVILQSQVDAAWAGVLFTRDVRNANSAEMLVEYGRGLADGLVDGSVTPVSLLIRDDGYQPVDQRTGQPGSLLNEAVISKLADAGRSLEEHFGSPQDIEWAVDRDGALLVVQCRPITTLGVSRVAGVERGGSRVTAQLGARCARPQPLMQSVDAGANTPAASPRNTVVWSNANVNENFPEPITPLLYSIASRGYYHYFRNLGLAFGIASERVEAMEHPLRNIIGTHGGRMYYNLTNIHAVLRAAPFGEFLGDAFNQFVGATPIKNDASLSPPRRGRFRELGEMARIASSAWRCFRRLEHRVARFEATVDTFAAATRPNRLAVMPPSELLGCWRGFMAIRCQWTDAALADAASMISYGLSQRLLKGHVGDEQDAAVTNRLLTGLRNVISGLPTQKLWELSRLVRAEPRLRRAFRDEPSDVLWQRIETDAAWHEIREAIHEFLEQWGFRCSGELLLTTPSYQEDPASLLDLIRGFVERDGESPDESLVEQEQRRHDETARVLKTLRGHKLHWLLPWPRQDFLARRLIRWTQQSIACRERVRLKQALLYSRCRRMALTIGDRLVESGWLVERDDIFFLTFDEIESLLGGAAMLPAATTDVVAVRKATHAQLAESTPPDRFELGFGDYWSQGHDEQHSTRCVDDGGMFAGTGVCGGTVVGKAVVLTDPSQFDQVSDGDILVTRQTDPGWGPVLFLVRGLVMERGGMLSHGAILAREYGIPTVVDVRNATEMFKTGQQLRVDGDRGVVEPLD